MIGAKDGNEISWLGGRRRAPRLQRLRRPPAGAGRRADEPGGGARPGGAELPRVPGYRDRRRQAAASLRHDMPAGRRQLADPIVARSGAAAGGGRGAALSRLSPLPGLSLLLWLPRLLRALGGGRRRLPLRRSRTLALSDRGTERSAYCGAASAFGVTAVASAR